jgi:ubiquitin C-terminal hydrolase
MKNSAPVDYPFVIDSADYAEEATGVYRLFGVVCHSGTLHGGHYTCVVKDPDRQMWYDISDSCVNKCSESDARQFSAYILFYENRSRP